MCRNTRPLYLQAQNAHSPRHTALLPRPGSSVAMERTQPTSPRVQEVKLKIRLWDQLLVTGKSQPLAHVTRSHMSPFIHFPQRRTALTVCHLCWLRSSLCEASPSSLSARGCYTDGESPHHLEQGSSWPPCRPEGSTEQTPGSGPRPCWWLHTEAEFASHLPPQSSCPIQHSVRAHA